MIKNTIIFIFLCFNFSFFCYSQQKEIDSIETVLSKIKIDSLYFKEVGQVAKQFRRGNVDVYNYFSKKYLSLSKLMPDSEEKADAIRERGIYYTNTNQLDSAKFYCNKALKVYQAINDEYGVCITRNSLAIIYNSKGDYVNAISNFKGVISYLETKGDKMKPNVLSTKMNIGGLYGDMEDHKTANQYFLDVYNDSMTKRDSSLLSSICINLCVNYKKLNELDKAIAFGLEAENIEKRPRSLANLYQSLASAYDKNKEFKKSYAYYLKELTIREKLKDSLGIYTTKHNIAYLLLDLREYDQAEHYFLSSNEFFIKHNELNRIKQSYLGLSDINIAKKNYKKALDYYKNSIKIKDTLLSEEKQKAITDLEVKYETEKTRREKDIAEKQLQISTLESSKNRNLFIGSSIIAALILVSSLIYYSRFKAKKQAEIVTLELKETQKRLALEKQYKDSELKALKAQMNPHFIFNALNSIQDYIVLNQKHLASDYLGKFADLIRNYLHFSDTGFISIPEEVHNLKLYLELEKLRFEDALDYQVTIDDKANSEAIKIPTMLIQPYVENALKHGLLHKKDNRKLSVSIFKPSEKIIQCIIEDNGIGREKSKAINQKRQHQHKSFALKATTERLDLLNYSKERKIGVEILDLKKGDEATGTKVILNIPIVNK